MSDCLKEVGRDIRQTPEMVCSVSTEPLEVSRNVEVEVEE